MPSIKLFKTLAVLVVLGVTAAIAAPTKAADRDPKDFVAEIADKAIVDIFTADIPQGDKIDRFREMFAKYFDIPTIGRFVVGKAWRGATDAQKTAFLDAFREMNILTWARRFDEYGGQTLEVTNSQPDGDNGVFVETQVNQTDGPPVVVTWRLRDRDGEWKVVDLVAEGVSMAITYRSEYSAVLQQKGGMDGLIATLNDKVASLKSGQTAAN